MSDLKTYGEVIRDIRTNKGLSQKELYSGIISKSYAIEFEKGNHDISLRLLEQILDRLMMEMDEFFYIYRGYKLSNHDEFSDKYSKAGNNNDIDALIELYQELHQREDPTSKVHQAEVRSRIRLLRHFNLTGNFEKNVILTEDIETITTYLNNLESWTLQEMQLFTNTLNYINYDQRDILFKTLINSMKKYERHERGRDVICTMLTNMIYELIMANQINYAEILLENLNSISSQYKTIFFKIVNRFFNGIIKIKRNHKDEGAKLAQSAIDVLYEFDESYQAKTLESILSQVLQ